MSDETYQVHYNGQWFNTCAPGWWLNEGFQIRPLPTAHPPGYGHTGRRGPDYCRCCNSGECRLALPATAEWVDLPKLRRRLLGLSGKVGPLTDLDRQTVATAAAAIQNAIDATYGDW